MNFEAKNAFIQRAQAALGFAGRGGAFAAGGGTYAAPCQLVGDFLAALFGD